MPKWAHFNVNLAQSSFALMLYNNSDSYSKGRGVCLTDFNDTQKRYQKAKAVIPQAENSIVRTFFEIREKHKMREGFDRNSDLFYLENE